MFWQRGNSTLLPFPTNFTLLFTFFSISYGLKKYEILWHGFNTYARFKDCFQIPAFLRYKSAYLKINEFIFNKATFSVLSMPWFENTSKSAKKKNTIFCRLLERKKTSKKISHTYYKMNFVEDQTNQKY